MKRAIGYTRVSTLEQAEGNLSLAHQEEAIKRYCERNEIYLLKIYTDPGVSAKTADRPALNEAIKFCQDNYQEVDSFIFLRIDRLSRSVQDYSDIRAMLLKYGISLCSVNEQVDESPAGKLQGNMLASFAQFDNDMKSQRTRDGMYGRVQEGGWVYPAPLGYRNLKDAMGRPTLEKTEVAPIIAGLFREYIRGGVNFKELSKEAEARGLTSAKGRPISYQSMINMLRNPVYAGYTYHGRPRTLVEGLHEGLIDKDEYYAIQEKIDGKKRVLSPTAADQWPLRGGFVKCGECGSPLTSSTPRGRGGIRYPTYACPKCRAKEVGHKVSIPREALHNEFEAALHNLTPTDAHLKVFKEVFLAKWRKAHLDQEKEKQKAEQELLALKSRRNKLVTYFLEDKVTTEEKIEQANLIDRQILTLKSKLSSISQSIEDAESVVEYGLRMIQNSDKFWRTASLKNQLRFQAVLFPEGVIYDFGRGFRTTKMNDLYLLIEQVSDEGTNLVPRGGFEPPALGLEVLCSIQLSYQGMSLIIAPSYDLRK